MLTPVHQILTHCSLLKLTSNMHDYGNLKMKHSVGKEHDKCISSYSLWPGKFYTVG